jgi:uncharacterized membrane protein
MRVPTAATLYDWVLLLHILAGMVWLGGLVALAVISALLLRSRDVEAVARFVRSLRIVGPVMLAPASLGVLVFGIWMVVDSDLWDFGQAWIIVALALVAAAVIIGAAFLSRAALAAQAAVDAGDDGTAIAGLRRWSWGVRVLVGLLVVATWDMVMKPGL